MKTSTLRRKRVVLPALATVAVLAGGGTVWAASADDVSGDERDRVATAATEAAGGGEAVEVEKADDPGEAYEVEVRLADGSEVDVTLDSELGVVTVDKDDRDDRDDRNDRDEADDRDDVGERPDADDRVLTAAERASAEKAALAAVGSGAVVDVDPSDDPGVAYEAEVRDAKGVEWDVDLAADFSVVAKQADR
ncbi:hypothetical protein CFH99_13375 [Nocardioides aromaticivorans]|uniref:PepSY domain-containing protein n=1 Tax=Nocardioides aromaticivorans TaxID=200618 RepID=A0ABX7PLK2_9ACTN|nr:PepSY domain-containing protein [Nocardioides aromaticivorans]QSR26617.1 hypothetical protein CFH99_13375 [Nocardioides aromaticivorans]